MDDAPASAAAAILIEITTAYKSLPIHFFINISNTAAVFTQGRSGYLALFELAHKISHFLPLHRFGVSCTVKIKTKHSSLFLYSPHGRPNNCNHFQPDKSCCTQTFRKKTPHHFAFLS